MRKCKTLHEVTKEYFMKHPEEDEEFMTPQELKKDFSCKENPPLDSVKSIMGAIRLSAYAKTAPKNLGWAIREVLGTLLMEGNC